MKPVIQAKSRPRKLDEKQIDYLHRLIDENCQRTLDDLVNLMFTPRGDQQLIFSELNELLIQKSLFRLSLMKMGSVVMKKVSLL